MAILRKARNLFTANVNSLSEGETNGKQRVIRFIERTIDFRRGAQSAAAAAVPVTAKVEDADL